MCIFRAGSWSAGRSLFYPERVPHHHVLSADCAPAIAPAFSAGIQKKSVFLDDSNYDSLFMLLYFHLGRSDCRNCRGVFPDCKYNLYAHVDWHWYSDFSVYHGPIFCNPEETSPCTDILRNFPRVLLYLRLRVHSVYEMAL